jgi:hypothetical protein
MRHEKRIVAAVNNGGPSHRASLDEARAIRVPFPVKPVVHALAYAIAKVDVKKLD